MANVKITKKIRCTIYTRKSSDEGLEQEFNSLDAQHEACASYIASQKHEGWKLVNKRYDDGGISGATMERSGLKALMADIDAGLIDMIVVYKIDRLTRSLSDFAKIVDQLDAKNASFVSVTQSFNTSTSLGRLTLNMLLSFAQFEREVTAERIRDKIAASKAKGLWMGGPIPFGYDPHPDETIRKLLINESEAASIKTIFELYRQLGNLSQVNRKCERLKIRSKIRPTYVKRLQGGGILTNGQIHHILTNPLYIGKIRHKDLVHEGQHEAIIEQALWDEVQAKLQTASARRRGQRSERIKGTNAKSDHAWLKGLMYDEMGDHLTPSHTKRNGTIIRYYISNRLITSKDPSGWRLPAKKIEQAIEATLLDHLQSQEFCLAVLKEPTPDKIAQLQKRIAAIERSSIHSNGLLHRIDLGPVDVSIKFNMQALANYLQLAEEAINERVLVFRKPFQLKRRGVESKVIIGDVANEPNVQLQNILAKATSWATQIKQGSTIKDISTGEGITPSYIRERIPMAFLSPRIQSLILEGQQPVEWTIKTFIAAKIPLDWNDQRKMFLT